MFVLEINPNKHAAIIKTITLNTFKNSVFQFSSVQILVYVRLSSADTRSPQLYHISIITTHVVITRKRCRYNEKRSRYNEKICRFNEKRSRYYEKICRFNEKRSRYYEKRSRYNEKRSRYYEKRSRYNEKRSRYYEKRSRYYKKRSRYNDIIEWKKYYMDGSITSPYDCLLVMNTFRWRC